MFPSGFAELARDNVLWLPFCRKHVVDQEGALLLACRRKAAALEEAREEAVAKLKKKELERGKGTENEDSAILLGELGGGWVVMVIKDEEKKTREREKEREEMRKMAEAKKRAKLPPTPIDKITTPWWDEFTPEEEEFETNRGSYEKPLWKEVFAAWKIARDFKMLHVSLQTGESFTNSAFCRDVHIAASTTIRKTTTPKPANIALETRSTAGGGELSRTRAFTRPLASLNL